MNLTAGAERSLTIAMTVRAAFLSAVLAVVATALAVGFPASQRAPVEPGLCWTIDGQSEHAATFRQLDRNIENAETCGARLEAVRLMQGTDVSGAYQGVYLFADEDGLSIAPSLDGPRRELLSQKDRERVDAAIAELMRERARRQGVTIEPPV